MADAVQVNGSLAEITDQVCAAQQLIKQDRWQGLAPLNELFR
jgi:hypothetical protein